MFADPIVLTDGSTTPSLNRTSSGDNKGEYRTDDGLYRITVSHNYGGSRNRRLLKIDKGKVAADPLQSGRNLPVNASVHIVVDSPAVGFDPTELKNQVLALTKFLTDTSAANTIKFIGGQS